MKVAKQLCAHPIPLDTIDWPQPPSFLPKRVETRKSWMAFELTLSSILLPSTILWRNPIGTQQVMILSRYRTVRFHLPCSLYEYRLDSIIPVSTVFYFLLVSHLLSALFIPTTFNIHRLSFISILSCILCVVFTFPTGIYIKLNNYDW